eukprot:TRINITY_DN1748_c0_g1_i2.p1 TRINITY_DN1748_c0_g1~~TRINITY_DN1748_c0_g1_i2.p1  ORF type:complete len:417 (+),score=57.33 TRINITY_DN1748_c0_g1_i2:53-1303(+)
MLGMVSSISVSVTQDSMSFVMIPIGDVIDNEYTMVSKLGMGGFGEIYCCLSSKMDKVAIKVERESKPGGLAEEERILRLLEGCKYTSRLTKSGKHNGHLAYLVMPLLGENLGNLRRQQPTNTFSLLTTLMLGRQMLRCLREVHDHGILHRDIKPGNFVLGTVEEGNPRTVIMIDYGLSRNHLDSNGVPHPEKKESRWVGSRKYMSLNTHNRKDQARRDDLWSLLYVLIEFRLGSLPWGELRGTESFEKIRNLKRVYDDQKLVCGLPQEFLYYMCYLKTLSYSDRPDYDYLDSLFASLFVRAGGNPGTPFDWETRESAAYNNRVEEEVSSGRRKERVRQGKKEREDKRVGKQNNSILTFISVATLQISFIQVWKKLSRSANCPHVALLKNFLLVQFEQTVKKFLKVPIRVARTEEKS